MTKKKPINHAIIIYFMDYTTLYDDTKTFLEICHTAYRFFSTFIFTSATSIL